MSFSREEKEGGREGGEATSYSVVLKVNVAFEARFTFSLSQLFGSTCSLSPQTSGSPMPPPFVLPTLFVQTHFSATLLLDGALRIEVNMLEDK